MTLNDLLLAHHLDLSQVLVLRHRPSEPELNKVLPWIAAERPDLYNAYQQGQGEKLEHAMLEATHVASFIRYHAGKALFIGLYSIAGSRTITREQFWAIPENLELKQFGMRGFSQEVPRSSSALYFNLQLVDFYSHWKGKLVVGWPPPERSWWRRAHRNTMPVLAIREESALDAAMPEWNELALTRQELRVLPTRWINAISQWRGIYYIFDESDGKGYVGSAYGESNLLGRWLSYAASGHGGNALLKKRNPENFTFTVLERVSPDMPAEIVIRLESTWKERLHTRAPFGLNDN